DQLASLVAAPKTRSFRALDVFPLLPPAGIVPLDPVQTLHFLVATAKPAFELPILTFVERRSAKSLTTDTTSVFQTLFGSAELVSNVVESKGRLGLISSELQEVKQEIAALRAELDGLKERAAGAAAASKEGGQAFGQRLAADLVTLLADTAAPAAG